jgi:anthranilate phosphoribosyltransferase
VSELAGGVPEENAQRLRLALAGGDTAAHRDALVIGAALALEVTGAEPDFASAVARARRALADGDGGRLLERIDEFAATEQ